MGSNLCCMKNSSHSGQIQEDEEEVIEKPITFVEDGRNEGIKRNSTLKECLLASPNLNPDHQHYFVIGNNEFHQKAYPPSSRIHHVLSPDQVQYCALNSPQSTPQSKEPSLLVLNHQYGHHGDQFLTSPEVGTQFYTPRRSFSSSDEVEKLGKVDEKDDAEEDDQAYSFTSIMRRNGSGRMKKKVSFRLPEAADIYLFYSSMENFEEISAF